MSGIVGDDVTNLNVRLATRIRAIHIHHQPTEALLARNIPLNRVENYLIIGLALPKFSAES